MRIYIAAHNQDEARKVAIALRGAGHAITSTWIGEDFSRTSTYTDEDKRLIAHKDALLVRRGL